MPKIKFRSWKPSSKSLELVERVNAVITDYSARGYSLTLRQVYYQCVARGFLPNSQPNYKMLGEVINNARYAGLIDWLAIEDRTRSLSGHGFYSNPDQLVKGIGDYWKTNPWPTQEHYFEVWVEKEALADVVAQACAPRFVNHFSCRGYVSGSEAYVAAERLRRAARQGKECHVIHLGDHDPSGIDMTRDITERLEEFGARFELKRIALNYDQIEQYNPPPNPAKVTDSRFEAYAALHGDESWELDALDPQVLVDLIQAEIDPLIDPDAWGEVERADLEERAVFTSVGDHWTEVKEFAEENGWLDDAREELGLPVDRE